MAKHIAKYEVAGRTVANDASFAEFIKMSIVSALHQFSEEIPMMGKRVDYASIKIACGYKDKADTLCVEIQGEDFNGIFKKENDGESE